MAEGTCATPVAMVGDRFVHGGMVHNDQQDILARSSGQDWFFYESGRDVVVGRPGP